MYFIAPIHLLLFMMRCSERRRLWRNLGSQVFANNGALRHLNQFASWASEHYHCLCGSWRCWEAGGWKQFAARLMAQAGGWWINTSASFLNDDMTILSIVNSAIASLPDLSRRLQELFGCREEPIGDGGQHTHNVTSILDNNTAAGWVKAAMKWFNPLLLRISYCGQQADGTSAAQILMGGGCGYLPLDDILRPPTGDMIDDIREASDDDAEMRRPNPRSFLKMNTGTRWFERKLQRGTVT